MIHSDWIKKDLRYNWHPYTQMKDCGNDPPILIDKARGIKLYDTKGNFYYDTISSWWCNVHGHNHPKIKEAIKKQLNSLEHVLFAGFTHKPAIQLAEKLIQITSRGIIDGKVRRNALQLKKEADEEQKEIMDQEMILETPAILRKK